MSSLGLADVQLKSPFERLMSRKISQEDYDSNKFLVNAKEVLEKPISIQKDGGGASKSMRRKGSKRRVRLSSVTFQRTKGKCHI
eukprot:6172944-Pleurochrysis_carterae.AAC.2